MTGESHAPSLRDSQKNLTRARILAAARAAFHDKGVAAVSMDEIAVKAGIGRATLYLHYSGKNAILLDLFTHRLHEQTRFHARLLALDPINLTTARQWISDFVDVLCTHRQDLALFHLSMAQEPELQAAIVQHREETLRLLAERYPRFRKAAKTGRATRKERAEALLLLFQIEHFASSIARDYPDLDREAGTDILAGRLLEFLKE